MRVNMKHKKMKRRNFIKAGHKYGARYFIYSFVPQMITIHLNKVK
jgi:hypothetical protein